MKSKIIITSIIVLIVIIAGGFIFFNNFEKQPGKIYSENYNSVLSKINEGNQYVIEKDLDDYCFSYRNGYRCEYSDSKQYLVGGNLLYYNLTSEEMVDLCYKFAHKGAVANCLKLSSTKETCLDFAKDNTYLQRICDLGVNQLIPSQKSGPYNYSNCYPEGCELLPSGSCTDANCMIPSDAVEPVKYSELK
jgi:hypothetical protein